MSHRAGPSFIQRAMDAIDDEDDAQETPFIEDLDSSEPMLQRLTRYWMDERNSPDILIWQGLVVQEALDKLKAQVRLELRALVPCRGGSLEEADLGSSPCRRKWWNSYN